MALKLVDHILPINGADAVRLARELAQREGISGGATLAGALQVCASAADGATVLCMLPDTGRLRLNPSCELGQWEGQAPGAANSRASQRSIMFFS